MPKRTKSSQRWLQEHESDVFVKRDRILAGHDQPQLIMSDMAPGRPASRPSTRTARCIWAELALDFAGKVLAPGGNFVVKVFQGRDFQPFVRQLRGQLGTVKVRRPPVSRQRSPELLLARTFNSG